MKRLLLSLAVGVLAMPGSAQAATRAPTPGTQAASLITTSSAVLTGYVNPNGDATTSWFQWGLSNKSLTNSTTQQAAGAGTTPVTLSASLTGLTPNTTYRFRMAAANTRGTRYGSTLSFKTPAVPLTPTVVTGSASGISQTGATLKGTVNPNGTSVTNCHFDWGISTTYGQIAPCGQAPGTGTRAVSVSAALSGLTASTSYHFRVMATNATGTNTGTDGTFTTLAAAPPKIIYLTFDDGPAGGASGYTAQVLSDLEAGGAKASFFETGTPSPDYYTTTGMALGANQPLIARERADGDQIGTHTWDHPDMTTLSCADQQTEIAKARTLQVQLTGGYDSELFRYPYFRNTACGDAYLASQGMVAMGADVDPSDWDATRSDTQIVNSVLRNAHDGSIVDLHDGTDVLDRGSPTYLPTLIASLKAAGYTFGTLPSAATLLTPPVQTAWAKRLTPREQTSRKAMHSHGVQTSERRELALQTYRKAHAHQRH